jgi:hypothetical protein
MKKPNFFLVGQPKSGSTSMYHYLAAHPDIFMCPFKEPRYFALDLHRESDRFHGRRGYFVIRTEEEYLDLFQGAEAERVIGEASPHYLFSKEAAEAIHAFASGAKILIMLREPVDFLHSWYWEMTARQHETEKSFEKALELEPRRQRGKGIPKTVGTPSFLYYSEWVRYSEQIRRYTELFEREQIKVVVFEEFTTQTDRIYRDVLEFLGVDPGFQADFSVHNPSRVPRFKVLRRVSRIPVFWNAARAFLPRSAYGRIDEVLSRIVTRPQEKPALDEELSRRLKERFRPEVEALGRLLGRDFVSLWHY